MAKKTKKHIVIDARIRQSSTGRYMDRLIENMQGLGSEYNFTVLLKPGDSWKPSAKNFSTVACNYKPYSFNPFKQITFTLWLRKLRADLIHFTMTPQDPVFYFGKIVTTTHDLTMLKFQRSSKLPNWVSRVRMRGYRMLMWQTHKKAKHIIVPTQFVADDVNKYHLFTNRKTTVTLESSEPPLPGKPKIPENAPDNFIMYTGSAFEHKNLERLISAFCLLKEQHEDLKLVLVGKREYHSKQLEKWIKRNTRTESVIFTGFIPDEELKWYYQNARAYVFPSLSEGFGLPGLEAMVHGCPVVSSNATCLPEVNGDAAEYFNPENIAEIAEAIDKVISSEALRKKLIAKGYENAKRFSWRKMATQTLQIYKDILGE
jgi:glycosyltransferase involved in cell wall biosynthesis